MNSAKNQVAEDTKSHLAAISSYAEKVNPNLARFYRITLKEQLLSSDDNQQESAVNEYKACTFCGCPLKIGNHAVKLVPRRPVTQRVFALMQKYAEKPQSLGCYHRRLIQDYKCSRNKLQVTCFSCKKTWTIDGQAYTERLKQREVSAHKHQATEERPVSKQDKKREKKKALRKRRKLKSLDDEEETAGLKFVKVKKDIKKDSETTTSSRITVQSSKKDTVERTSEKGKDKSKTKQGSRLHVIEQLQDVKPANLNSPDKERKKHRFISKLSHILKQEKAKEKTSHDAPEKSKKVDLQAFLSSL